MRRRHRKRCTLRPPGGAVCVTDAILWLWCIKGARSTAECRVSGVSQPERAVTVTSRRPAVEHRGRMPSAASAIWHSLSNEHSKCSIGDTPQPGRMKRWKQKKNCFQQRSPAVTLAAVRNLVVCVTEETEEMYLLPVPRL